MICTDGFPHRFVFLRKFVDFTRHYNEIGLEKIVVDAYYEFFCSKCLTVRYKLMETENLMLSDNWIARFKYYSNKYNSNAEDVTVDTKEVTK